MSASVLNILDLIEEVGIEVTESIISDFSTRQRIGEEPLNSEIEYYLKNNSIQFAREKKSVTYLVIDEEKSNLLGYFAIAHKSIEVPADGLSKSRIKTIERYAQFHKELNAYVLSAFLIGQFGKNYAVKGDERISGDEMMRLTISELSEIQHRIGGGFIYLDCEPDVKLINFYEHEGFRLFGERISEKDGKRYLQYMRFF